MKKIILLLIALAATACQSIPERAAEDIRAAQEVLDKGDAVRERAESARAGNDTMEKNAALAECEDYTEMQGQTIEGLIDNYGTCSIKFESQKEEIEALKKEARTSGLIGAAIAGAIALILGIFIGAWGMQAYLVIR